MEEDIEEEEFNDQIHEQLSPEPSNLLDDKDGLMPSTMDRVYGTTSNGNTEIRFDLTKDGTITSSNG